MVSDLIALVSGPISRVGEPLASAERILAPRESLLALIKLGRPAIELFCAAIELTALGFKVLSPAALACFGWLIHATRIVIAARQCNRESRDFPRSDKPSRPTSRSSFLTRIWRC